jgi:hypothetical protein
VPGRLVAQFNCEAHKTQSSAVVGGLPAVRRKAATATIPTTASARATFRFILGLLESPLIERLSGVWADANAGGLL